MIVEIPSIQEIRKQNSQKIEAALNDVFAQSQGHEGEYESQVGELVLKDGNAVTVSIAYRLQPELGLSILSLVDEQGASISTHDLIFNLGPIFDKGVQAGQIGRIAQTVSTKPSYEGNGFATPLINAVDQQVNDLLAAGDYHGLTVLVAADEAREQSGQQKSGWSSKRLEKLGFFDNSDGEVSKVLELLGESFSADELSRTWIKIYQT